MSVVVVKMCCCHVDRQEELSTWRQKVSLEIHIELSHRVKYTFTVYK